MLRQNKKIEDTIQAAVERNRRKFPRRGQFGRGSGSFGGFGDAYNRRRGTGKVITNFRGSRGGRRGSQAQSSRGSSGGGVGNRSFGIRRGPGSGPNSRMTTEQARKALEDRRAQRGRPGDNMGRRNIRMPGPIDRGRANRSAPPIPSRRGTSSSIGGRPRRGRRTSSFGRRLGTSDNPASRLSDRQRQQMKDRFAKASAAKKVGQWGSAGYYVPGGRMGPPVRRPSAARRKHLLSRSRRNRYRRRR